MDFNYSLNERPPLKHMAIYGLQWFVISVPLIIILGKVVASIQSPAAEAQLAYLQKLFFISGVVLFAQLLSGHRLPLIVGPAAVLLTGILVNAGAAKVEIVYSSIMVGGLIITLLSASGLLSWINVLFTKRITGVVLLLIAFTMLPTVLNLVTGPEMSFEQLVFSAALLVVMLAGQHFCSGLLRATIIVWALIIGSISYYLIVAPTVPSLVVPTNVFSGWGNTSFSFVIDPAVVISFVFCFLALVANDVGSIQTTAQLVAVTDIHARTRSGLFVTGLGNMIAGYFGVIGPVNYSLSTGVILSSGCASRYTLIPSAIGMMILAFTPGVIHVFSCIPSAVVGTLLFYMMCSQVAGGFEVLRYSLGAYNFETGLIIGVPIMIGTMVAFFPSYVISKIPLLVRPLLANGFVVGLTVALFLEHLLVRRLKNKE